MSCRGDVGHLSGAELSRIENLFLRNEHPIGGWAWAYWSRSSSTRGSDLQLMEACGQHDSSAVFASGGKAVKHNDVCFEKEHPIGG